MTVDKVKKAQELLTLIDTTEKALVGLKEIRKQTRKNKEYRNYDDGLYSLNIGEYKDGSGKNAELGRYMGNAKLINIIIDEVERQLQAFKSEFEEL